MVVFLMCFPSELDLNQIADGNHNSDLGSYHHHDPNNDFSFTSLTIDTQLSCPILGLTTDTILKG